MNPSVSVVIPVYNGEQYLVEAIESVYEQTVQPAEVIAVDDGSTDGSPALLKDFAAKLPSTFRVMRKTNSGPASARNVGIAATTSDFVAFLDADDTWRPTKLERQLHHFASEPDLGMSFVKCVGDPELVWDPDPSRVVEELLRRCIPPTSSAVMVRRDALARVPPFDETITGFAEDWLMWLRLAAAGVRCGYLPEELAEHRVHAANTSGSPEEYYASACEVMQHFFADDSVFAASSADALRARSRRERARWHLLAAIDAAERGKRAAARRHLATAALTRPLSVRPGWLRLV